MSSAVTSEAPSGVSPNAETSDQSGADNPQTNKLLEDLKGILEKQTYLFACGGHVPIRERRRSSQEDGRVAQLPSPPSERRELDPITIRWDVPGGQHGEDAAGNKLSLPLVHGATADLSRLVHHSQPATFGRGGEDVFDESYRKAVQINPDAFCTTFEPYSAGIIDTLAQVLLPSVSDSLTLRGVRADLYKLNVYSGPSGRFKSHIDTPRSSWQFGSLVVCLPVDHEGGQLKVRHKGQEMTFDWSTSRASTDRPGIHWAAFYSDCEHEVLEVTSGHRLTLTYNLLAVRGAGRLTGVSPTLNPAQLPLYQAFRKVLSQNIFGSQGCTLGFWCSHVYAYNNETETPLPATLKGVDAVVWESLQALGLEPKIAPVIRMDERAREMFSEWYDDPKHLSYPWATRLREKLPSAKPSEWIVGHKFGIHVDRHYQVEEIWSYHSVYNDWGSYIREPVHWLTKPKHSELQLVYTAYGNNASADVMYSSCAILVEIHADRLVG